MFRLIVVWILNALALLVLPYVVPSIHVDNFRSALVAALVLAFINTLIRPLFVLLTDNEAIRFSDETHVVQNAAELRVGRLPMPIPHRIEQHFAVPPQKLGH